MRQSVLFGRASLADAVTALKKDRALFELVSRIDEENFSLLTFTNSLWGSYFFTVTVLLRQTGEELTAHIVATGGGKLVSPCNEELLREGAEKTLYAVGLTGGAGAYYAPDRSAQTAFEYKYRDYCEEALRDVLARRRTPEEARQAAENLLRSRGVSVPPTPPERAETDEPAEAAAPDLESLSTSRLQQIVEGDYSWREKRAAKKILRAREEGV